MYYSYNGKLILKTILWAAILTGLVISAAWLVVLCVSGLFPQMKIGLLVKLLCLFAAIVVIAIFHDTFLRYPFYKTFTARRIINASVEIVWEQVRPRARNRPYNVLISSIRKIDENTYRYYDANSNGSKKVFTDVRLVDETPYKKLELNYYAGDGVEDIIKTSREYTYTFEPLTDSKTEITVNEVHWKPSLFTFYIFEFLGAHRDDLRQLASVCENQANISWASAQLAMEELASRPDAKLGEVLRPMGDAAIIAVTALITFAAMILVWIIWL